MPPGTPVKSSGTHAIPEIRKSLNIILFGETGVGKSSLVNLIAGKTVTKIADDLKACTMKYMPYAFSVHDVSYTVWDTRGLEDTDTELGAQAYLDAVKQARDLIEDLTKKEGVDLLVLCHKQGHITSATKSNYRLFYEVLCEGKVPVSLVITHLERQARMEDWWDRNSQEFKKRGMSFATHACVTGLPDHSKSKESKRAIERMLGEHDGQKRYVMPREVWVRRFAQQWIRPKGIKEVDLQDFLGKRCGFSVLDAQEIAGVLLKKGTEGSNSDDSKRQASSSTSTGTQSDSTQHRSNSEGKIGK